MKVFRAFKIGTTVEMKAAVDGLKAAEGPAPIVDPNAMAGALKARRGPDPKDRVRQQMSEGLSEIGPANPPKSNYTSTVAPSMSDAIKAKRNKS